MLSRLALAVPLLLASPEYVNRAEKAPAARYFGVKQFGTDPQNYDSLELVIDAKGGAKLTWVQGIFAGGKKSEVELTEIKLDTAGFAATVKGARPPSVAERFVGKFVTKYPPGKGQVERGILFPGDWFLKSGDE